ncbi:MAG: DUF4157 domain-containing protein [Myxococcales bacterium]|nr:DUF4157 domain-containing protein [Myxococcales bacterium]
MSQQRKGGEFWFEQQHEDLAQQHEGRAEREHAPLSPVAQLQRYVGNSRLLQLRARNAAVQRRMSMSEATQQAETHAEESFAEQRQVAAAEPDISIPSGGQALPKGVQTMAEQHLGVSMSDVQVVHGADAATKPIQAQAFATEDAGVPKVVLSSDVDLQSREGQFTLMHELSHIGQQKKSATGSLQGLGGDEGHREHLESEADKQGARMLNQLHK